MITPASIKLSRYISEFLKERHSRIGPLKHMHCEIGRHPLLFYVIF